MLEARPVGFASWNYKVFEGKSEIARLSFRTFSYSGTLHVGEVPFTLKSPWISRRYAMLFEGVRVASADQASRMTRNVNVRLSGTLIDRPDEEVVRYTLKPRTFFSNDFELREDGERVGSVKRGGIFSRRARVNLPGLPLSAQVFVLALVVIQWRQASGGGS